jgi:hypothetical protein
MKSAEMVYQSLDDTVKQNLHPKGFVDTFNLMEKYISICKQQKSNTHWVCDSAPGQGKTTALIELMKTITDKKDRTPFLLVFNNKDALENVFKAIEDYAIVHYRYNLVQYVNEDNLCKIYDEIDQYQILCITQQRLRDLRLGFGSSEKYLMYQTPSSSWEKRLLIIDEIPIFINDTQFNISSKDNCVDWFDTLGRDSQLSEDNIQRGRSLIMELFNKEMQNNSLSTQRLARMIEGTPKKEELNGILSKLNVDIANRDQTLKFRWFRKLYSNDNVGAIEQTKYGNRILCAERIDYRGFGNILILDGTSGITPSIYNNEYEYKRINNYHNYERIHLHHQIIATSKENRSNPDAKQLIANDIFTIRNDMRLFPLMAKGDVISYRKNKVITSEQSSYFDDYNDFIDEENSDAVSLSLFNTVGKNILNDYSALALLNLPIRNPIYYKKIAISIYGTDTDISLNDGNFSNWFVDERVEKIFSELVLADLVQISHRCRLRNINESTPVHLYLYTKQPRWIDALKSHFKLKDKNMEKTTIKDNYHDRFISICHDWASKSSYHCLNDKYDHLFGISYTAKQIGGRKFKDWLNLSWKDDEKKAIIIKMFKDSNILIKADKNGYKTISYITDVAEY